MSRHKSEHGTLTPDTVQPVILDADDGTRFAVVYVSLPNADGDAYFNVARGLGEPETPAIGGDDTWRLGENRFERAVEITPSERVTVYIISASAIDYSVEAD